MVVQPMAFCWDDRGRLWVAENLDYESRFGAIEVGKVNFDAVLPAKLESVNAAIADKNPHALFSGRRFLAHPSRLWLQTPP